MYTRIVIVASHQKLPRLFCHLHPSVYKSNNIDDLVIWSLGTSSFWPSSCIEWSQQLFRLLFLDSFRPIMVGFLQGCEGSSWVSLQLSFPCLLQGMLQYDCRRWCTVANSNVPKYWVAKFWRVPCSPTHLEVTTFKMLKVNVPFLSEKLWYFHACLIHLLALCIHMPLVGWSS